MRKLFAVICVGVAFAASAAIAVAENGALRGDEKPGDVELVFPESLKGRDVAFKRAVEFDRAAAPETKPGPVIKPDEIHVPDEPVKEVFVKHCKEVVENKALEREPLCEVVFLMDARQIEAGVYNERELHARFSRFVQEGGVK